MADFLKIENNEQFLACINSASHFAKTKLSLVNHSIPNQRLAPKNKICSPAPSHGDTHLFQLNFGIVA